MIFFADECFDARLTTNLHGDGYDVFSVSEAQQGASDDDVLHRAYADGRIVLTEDKDFGELVYRLRQPAAGVVLLRMDTEPITLKWRRLRNTLRLTPDRITGHFVVIEPRRTRFRPLPS